MDLTAADSSLSLVYAYNSSATTDLSNTAVGSLLLNGLVVTSASDTATITDINQNGFYQKILPGKKMRMANSAVGFRNGAGEDPGHPNAFDDKTRYWYMEGKDAFGNPKPGGPFDIWNGNIAADQRTVLGCGGPFIFAAGDTQTIWYALIGAKGISNTSAIDTLDHYAQQIRNTFYGNINSLIDIDKQKENKPDKLVLHQNYPNPFNPSTTITYQLPEHGRVSLKIYNVLGQEIRTLVNGTQTAGLQTVQWDGKNSRGQAVSSGVYFYRLETPGFTKTMKMMMMR